MTARKAGVSVCVFVGLLSSTVWADVFGTGANQFSMDFVTIPGPTNPDYRMGTYEVTNETNGTSSRRPWAYP